MSKIELKKVTLDSVKDLNRAGLSKAQCAITWASCLHDAALGGLGTSDPGGNACTIYQKYCMK
ncbi:hypothetical protein IGI71_000231 [Enterococcus sp. DIV1279b]|uniref:sublancin family glycopeptide n=1 Tax=Enterococcus TaxID=1350 RepID=UPI001883D0D5|nr:MULTISPECIES: sublancin family glycopeptide [Enterococcus]MBE9908838.1 hypothetical protein [Enterococcus casseliflavus]MCO5533200.1 hypothetical protein [Enterococcus faecium]